MELLPTAISAGYAAGLNAYGTVLMLGVLGRAGFGEVPDELTTTPAGLRLGINTSPDVLFLRKRIKLALERRRQRRRGPSALETEQAPPDGP
jgi:hypothetical protein